jgi:hypothetical protein
MSEEKGIPMETTYEYKFVRLGEYRGSAWFGVSDKARNAYEDVVHEHARDGWRLVQIFAPGVAAFGAAKYYELIFERERAQDATAAKAPVGSGSAVQHGDEVAVGRTSDHGNPGVLCVGRMPMRAAPHRRRVWGSRPRVGSRVDVPRLVSDWYARP